MLFNSERVSKVRTGLTPIRLFHLKEADYAGVMDQGRNAFGGLGMLSLTGHKFQVLSILPNFQTFTMQSQAMQHQWWKASWATHRHIESIRITPWRWAAEISKTPGRGRCAWCKSSNGSCWSWGPRLAVAWNHRMPLRSLVSWDVLWLPRTWSSGLPLMSGARTGCHMLPSSVSKNKGSPRTQMQTASWKNQMCPVWIMWGLVKILGSSNGHS